MARSLSMPDSRTANSALPAPAPGTMCATARMNAARRGSWRERRTMGQGKSLTQPIYFILLKDLAVNEARHPSPRITRRAGSATCSLSPAMRPLRTLIVHDSRDFSGHSGSVVERGWAWSTNGVRRRIGAAGCPGLPARRPAGFDHHLAKPIDSAGLHALLRRC